MARKNGKKCRRKHRAECAEKEECEIRHAQAERKTRNARRTPGAASNSDVPCPCPCPCPPEEFDAVIVGSGPHALSVLSALSEKRANLRGWEVNYDLNHKKGEAANGWAILVIDPTGWLHGWNQRFKNLRIEWLRSPYHAHPDATEDGAMLAYAQSNGLYRANTKPIDTFWESESALKGQFLLSSGLFDLPSSSLFSEFCDTLLPRYPHTFHQASVTSVSMAPSKKGSKRLRVECSDKSKFIAKNVIFAMGAPGLPLVPPNFAGARVETLKCKKEEKESAGRPCEEPPMTPVYHMADKEAFQPIKKGGKVVVVGGGLSAVQTALRFASEGGEVTLCSRRPLVSQVFDLPLSFFDPLQHRRDRFEYYNLPIEERLAWIQKKRNGGTVPPFYIELLKKERRIEHVVDITPEVIPGGLRFSCGREIEGVEKIILCTGSSVDCNSLGLMKKTYENLSEKLGLEVVTGLPVVDEELKWGGADSPLHVVGALAMLQLGPDAPNLMGAKRGAEVIASAIGVYDDHFEDGGIRTNRYNLLAED